MTIYHNLCQLLSHALETLSSVEALQESAEHLYAAVSELEKKVEMFKLSVRHIISFETPVLEIESSHYFDLERMISLQHLYYLLQLEIHTTLAFPWYHNGKAAKDPLLRRDCVNHSSSVVIKVARETILMSRLVHIDASSAVG